ncbi:50S ribosomal protein L28 [Thermanaerothrix sp. 4228-RoL]|nr:50S ribosomal protein L28 [Thermanaerothrix sp. 4228-RoL]
MRSVIKFAIADYFWMRKGLTTMAKCEHCGKTTTFGHRRSFSMRATNRAFKPNLQRVTLFINGRKVRKTLCTKCIKSLAKTS